ncbi:hypothetical protein BDF14DRAFT_1828361, partial [Spinellus fusiger]
MKSKENEEANQGSIHRGIFEKATEVDKVYVEGLVDSVGTRVKNEALKRYQQFSCLDTNNQTIASLGMNSLLDLSYSYPDGQSVIFTRKQWKQLKQMFPSTESKFKDNEMSEKLIEVIETILDLNNTASTSHEKKTNNIKALKNTYTTKDDRFLIFLLKHLIKIQRKYSYLFDEEVDCSESDFMAKIWIPIIEKLFMDTKLRP